MTWRGSKVSSVDSISYFSCLYAKC